MKIKIVYFAYLLPDNWEPIITEQLDALKKLELYNLASEIFISVISNLEELNKLKLLLKQKYNKLQVINIYNDNVFEYPGIKTLYELAHDKTNTDAKNDKTNKNDTDDILLYFHSKGITSHLHDMRTYLFKNTIENYEEYINEFKNNKDLDIAGAVPHTNGFIYFNFFWIRSNYIKKYCSKPEINPNRFIWEVWIGKEFSTKKHIITYSSIIGYAQINNSSEIWTIATKPKLLYMPHIIPDNTILDNIPNTILDTINNTINNDVIPYINRYINTNNILVDLSYDNIANIFYSKFKKIITLSENNTSNNIIFYNKELCNIKIKELLYYNIYQYNDKISLIYCNFKEELDHIIEDLFHHAYINKINLLIKYNSTYEKYKYLFSYFNYNSKLVEENNLILFEPKNDIHLQMIKNNITVLIIGYNQYTYIKNMVSQLEKYTNDIIIIDNKSTYKPLLDYYETDYKYSLLKMTKNLGHKVYEEQFVNKLVGSLFIITDPDLEFNSQLPKNFITQLINLSNEYKTGKIGFALEINSPNIRPELTYANMPLKLWEGNFWNNKIQNSNYELYRAPIDTTFCLINKLYSQYGVSIRVAGNFTCKHLPWYINFYDILLEDEYDEYLKNNISTNYWHDNFKIKKINYDWIKNKLANKSEYLSIGNNKFLNIVNQYFKKIYIVSKDNNCNVDNSVYFNNLVVSIKTQDNDITLKELFYKIISNNILADINFVSCDYDGLEECILEDLLYLCYINNISLCIIFNFKKWVTKTINNFTELLNLFTIYNNNNIITDISEYDNTILYFEVNKNKATEYYKKNMSVIIIGYNQYTYIKNMVSQLEKYTTDIIIIDNCSTYPKLLEYYEKEYKYTLLKMDKNYGHSVYNKNFINRIIGDIYILTDPDIEFNENLPSTFIIDMINILTHFEAERIGFALEINSPFIRSDCKSFGKTIVEWEKQYWIYKLYYSNFEIYNAAVDTTFCLVNKKNKGGHYRVAGNFIAKHLPWYIDFDKKLCIGEYEYYLNNNISTNYWKK